MVIVLGRTGRAKSIKTNELEPVENGHSDQVDRGIAFFLAAAPFTRGVFTVWRT